MVSLSLHHDVPASISHYRTIETDGTLARLRSLDTRVRRKGLASLDPSKNKLIPIGMEIDGAGRVTKNGYGVFHLAWRALEDGDWHERVQAEVAGIEQRIRQRHGTRLRFLIWAGMGGSAEDKSMYSAVGLLAKGPRLYVLDSTDPAKLKHILADMTRRAKGDLAAALKSTLVVGMAMGMTSYEPVVNLEKLAALFDRQGVDSRPNFLYMTLSGSLLDRFALGRGYRRVELQLDNGNTTAGRHSGPLTRGSLYPLALARVDLASWIEGASLDDAAVQAAFRLASFLHSQGEAGRDKVTLLLPRSWQGAAIWTKQDFEESLGKSEETGIIIAINEKIRLADYRPPRDAAQDRVFLAIQRKRIRGPEAAKINSLRRAGYPVATVTLAGAGPLSAYMQFIHYTVFGLAFLRNMNFVTQPGVELYKSITNKLHQDAAKHGGIRRSPAWKKFQSGHASIGYRGLTLHYPFLDQTPNGLGPDAAAAYAAMLRHHCRARLVDHAELTFFGDTRYDPRGRAVARELERAAQRVFRSLLRMPVDVYEGPAMNHSYHEMIIGHGRCFSTVLLSGKPDALPAAGYTADYHTAQFLATQMALAERGRAVAAIVLKDLETSTLASLSGFFQRVAALLKDRSARA